MKFNFSKKDNLETLRAGLPPIIISAKYSTAAKALQTRYEQYLASKPNNRIPKSNYMVDITTEVLIGPKPDPNQPFAEIFNQIQREEIASSKKMYRNIFFEKDQTLMLNGLNGYEFYLQLFINEKRNRITVDGRIAKKGEDYVKSVRATDFKSSQTEFIVDKTENFIEDLSNSILQAKDATPEEKALAYVVIRRKQCFFEDVMTCITAQNGSQSEEFFKGFGTLFENARNLAEDYANRLKKACLDVGITENPELLVTQKQTPQTLVQKFMAQFGWQPPTNG